MSNYFQKVSILMPIYNDAPYIESAIQSVLRQNYKNWELIIVNDGSTDNTGEIIQKYFSENIKYFYQKNSGQLNALKTASQFITGDYVTLLHSDDMLENYALENAVEILSKNKGINGIFGDLIRIDEKGNKKGFIRVVDSLNEHLFIDILIREGSNIIPDCCFVRKDIFFNQVYNNYLVSGSFYWFNLDNFKILKLKKIEPYYKYRIYSDNYNKTEVGQFLLYYGCLRLFTRVSQQFELTWWPFQVLFWRLLFKLPFLKNQYSRLFKPLYKKGDSNKIFAYNRKIRLKLLKRMGENFYTKSLIAFLEKTKSSRILYIKEDIIVDDILIDDFYFYQCLKSNKLPKLYLDLLNEALEGLCLIETSEANSKKIKQVLNFLNLPIPIKVI